MDTPGAVCWERNGAAGLSAAAYTGFRSPQRFPLPRSSSKQEQHQRAQGQQQQQQQRCRHKHELQQRRRASSSADALPLPQGRHRRERGGRGGELVRAGGVCGGACQRLCGGGARISLANCLRCTSARESNREMNRRQ